VPKEAISKEAISKEAISKEAISKEAIPMEAIPKEAILNAPTSLRPLPHYKKNGTYSITNSQTTNVLTVLFSTVPGTVATTRYYCMITKTIN
jgi:hypothetical protein